MLNWNSETNEIWVTNCNVLQTPEKIKSVEAIYYMINLVRQTLTKPEISCCDKAVVEFPAAFFSKTFSAGSMTPLSAISGASYSFLRNFEDEKSKVELIYPTVWNKRRKKDKTAELIQEIFGTWDTWKFDKSIKNPKLAEHVIDALGMCYHILERDYL
jgi:hypothetical protein